MKIRTSITINTDDDSEFIIEISEENSRYTIIRERCDDNDPIDEFLNIPNNKLREFAHAINEHIRIHGL